MRVDFVGKVLSPNTCTSPITQFHAALIDLVLVDWETVQSNAESSREVYRFTPLGACRYGHGIVVADAHGRELHIESPRAPRVVPLSNRPMPLDTPVPPELREAARSSQHMLSYRETRFSEGDRVRVIATVTRARVVLQAGGYRDASAPVLVPVDGERLELRELV